MPRIPSPEIALSIGNFLRDSNYETASLARDLDLDQGLHANLDNLQALLQKTEGPSPLAVLARLFFVGQPRPLSLCRPLIPDPILENLIAAELLKVSGEEEVLPLAVIIPYGKFLFAADLSQTRPGNPEMVMGASASTRLLAGCMIHEKTETTLDVGSGNGVLSLEAAAHSGHVMGIDINRRSVEFATFNAAMNGVSNVAFLTGDTFGPAKGKKFGHIVCNPPFLMGPSQVSAYCDSPLELDGFSRYLAVEAPSYLEEGGYFQMLCEWVRIEDEPWENRLKEWTAHSGCDVLVVTGTKINPVDYSERRHIEAQQIHGHEPEEALSRRLEYFRERKVQLIQGGVITMRKRKGSNWFSIFDTENAPLQAGNAIHDRFETLTFLSLTSAEQLLQAKLRLSDGTELEQRSRLGPEGFHVQSSKLLATEGLRDSLRLDEVVANFIRLFDGTRTVEEIASSVSNSLDWSLEDARKQCLALAKRLLQSSFVKPL